MRLSQMFRFVPGWVRVEAEGGYPERLFNAIARQEISVWGLHRRQEWTRFCCFARDYRRLRQPARRACVRMRVRQKHGLPFWLHRYRHRKGLVAGALLYGVILALLAPRIWVVQVVGNTATPAAATSSRAFPARWTAATAAPPSAGPATLRKTTRRPSARNTRSTTSARMPCRRRSEFAAQIPT